MKQTELTGTSQQLRYKKQPLELKLVNARKKINAKFRNGEMTVDEHLIAIADIERKFKIDWTSGVDYGNIH